MKALIVEDDFTSRLLMQELLLRHGTAHVAVNGREAVAAVATAIRDGVPYDLICLDVMLPEMDGQRALRRIRELESLGGLGPGQGAKILMTTALHDRGNIMQAFREQCDGYLVKPIDGASLLEHLRTFGLIDPVPES